MLKKFVMEDYKSVSTPIIIGCKLRKDDESKEVDQRLYISMIYRLLYVTTSRLDVMQVVGQVTRFQEATKETHVLVVKRIFKYLKGTTDFGLWYLKGNYLTLDAYTYAYSVVSSDDKRSTRGFVFCLGDCLVYQLIKKQSLVSLSKADEKYIAIEACYTHVLQTKQTLQDIQVKCDEPIQILYDNTSAINISKDPVMHSKIKYIPIKLHFLQEQVTEKNIQLEYIGTKEQIVDIFTKPLPRETFEHLRQRLGVISTPN